MTDDPTDPDRKWALRLDRERRSRRQAEQLAERGMRELWLANQTLEEKVRERTATLDRTLKALEQASHVRQELLADLGHELATPLHAITGSLELLDTAPLSPGDHALVAQARTSAQRLDGVLQAILAVSSVGRDGHANDEEARSPSDVLSEVFGRWQRKAARHGQLLAESLDAESPGEPITLHWQRLVTAVDAIIDACVQYASSGPLHLELTVQADAVSFSVDDSGPGLPDGLPTGRIPTPLTWATAGRRGIGLAVAQRMADQYGDAFTVSLSDLGGIRAVMTVKR